MMRMIPGEYGGWAMLAACFAVGAACGGGLKLQGLVLVAACAAVFIVHQNTVARFSRGSGDGMKARWMIILFLVLMHLFGVVLIGIFKLKLLLPIAAFATVLLVFAAVLERRRARSLAVQLARVLAICLVVPAASYAASGSITMLSLGASALCALYFCGAVLHVRSLARGGAGAAYASAVYHLGAMAAAAVLCAFGALPWFAGAAILPGAARAFAGARNNRGEAISIRRTGFAEIGYAAAFVAIAVTAIAAHSHGGVPSS